MTGAFVLLCACLTGCAVDQAREVETYRKVIDLPPTTPWDSTNQLTLREAMILANRNNENLAAQGEQYLRALINRHRAVANFLPTVDLGAAYERNDLGDDNDDNGNDDPDEFDVFGELNYNLFNGFRDVNAYWRDTFVIEQRRLDLLSFQESLLLDVAAVYYQILRAEASVRVLENSLTVQEERLRDTRGRLDAGVARPLDVAQTEAQVSATRALLISARRDVQNARDLLVLTTGAAVGDAVLADLFNPPSDVHPLNDFIENARSNREDLFASAAAIEAARREVEVAFGQYYPSVALNLTGFLYRESVPSARDWEGILVASVPIFSAGRIRADVREAWSFYRESLLVRSFLDRQVVQQVSQAYHDLIASEARLAELHVRLSAAAEAFRQANASYEVGLATNLDRIQSQDALLEAQLALASEEYERKFTFLRLIRATGVLREQLESLIQSAATQPTTQETLTQPATNAAP